MSSEITYITTTKGEILSVVVPYAIWERLEPSVQKLLRADDKPVQRPNPWKTLKRLCNTGISGIPIHRQCAALPVVRAPTTGVPIPNTPSG